MNEFRGDFADPVRLVIFVSAILWVPLFRVPEEILRVAVSVLSGLYLGILVWGMIQLWKRHHA